MGLKEWTPYNLVIDEIGGRTPRGYVKGALRWVEVVTAITLAWSD